MVTWKLQLEHCERCYLMLVDSHNVLCLLLCIATFRQLPLARFHGLPQLQELLLTIQHSLAVRNLCSQLLQVGCGLFLVQGVTQCAGQVAQIHGHTC